MQDQLETRDKFLSRILSDGEVILAEFNCSFPTNFIPQWKLVLLCIFTLGLYLLVLAFNVGVIKFVAVLLLSLNIPMERYVCMYETVYSVYIYTFAFSNKFVSFSFRWLSPTLVVLFVGIKLLIKRKSRKVFWRN